MPRLAESPSVLAEIRQKALRNAQSLNTYGKRAEFGLGRVVISFEQRCEIERKLRPSTHH